MRAACRIALLVTVVSSSLSHQASHPLKQAVQPGARRFRTIEMTTRSDSRREDVAPRLSTLRADVVRADEADGEPKAEGHEIVFEARRFDEDGGAYRWCDFVRYYGYSEGVARWDKATEAEPRVVCAAACAHENAVRSGRRVIARMREVANRACSAAAESAANATASLTALAAEFAGFKGRMAAELSKAEQRVDVAEAEAAEAAEAARQEAAGRVKAEEAAVTALAAAEAAESSLAHMEACAAEHAERALAASEVARVAEADAEHLRDQLSRLAAETKSEAEAEEFVLRAQLTTAREQATEALAALGAARRRADAEAEKVSAPTHEQTAHATRVAHDRSQHAHDQCTRARANACERHEWHEWLAAVHTPTLPMPRHIAHAHATVPMPFARVQANLWRRRAYIWRKRAGRWHGRVLQSEGGQQKGSEPSATELALSCVALAAIGERHDAMRQWHDLVQRSSQPGQPDSHVTDEGGRARISGSRCSYRSEGGGEAARHQAGGAVGEPPLVDVLRGRSPPVWDAAHSWAVSEIARLKRQYPECWATA